VIGRPSSDILLFISSWILIYVQIFFLLVIFRKRKPKYVQIFFMLVIPTRRNSNFQLFFLLVIFFKLDMEPVRQSNCTWTYIRGPCSEEFTFLRFTGDPKTIDNLRFKLMSSYFCLDCSFKGVSASMLGLTWQYKLDHAKLCFYESVMFSSYGTLTFIIVRLYLITLEYL